MTYRFEYLTQHSNEVNHVTCIKLHVFEYIFVCFPKEISRYTFFFTRDLFLLIF